MGQKEAWEDLFKKGKFGWTTPDMAVVNIIPLLKKRGAKKILDLGCGIGRHIVYLAKQGFFVTGTDISSTALAQARKWLEKENITNCRLFEHDMTKLPFPDENFDAVISINVIHHNHLKKIKNTVNEIGRVLKKRGLVLVTISSKKDYKFGIGKKLEEDTYMLDEGADKTVIHHFFDEKSSKELFSKFEILEIEERIESSERKNILHDSILKNIKEEKVNNFHWQILAEKL